MLGWYNLCFERHVYRRVFVSRHGFMSIPAIVNSYPAPSQENER